jgi:hypothetical protein
VTGSYSRTLGMLAFTDPGANFMDGKNILSVVVEFDRARLPGRAELFGVVGETLTCGSVNLRIERIGRPVHDLLLDPTRLLPAVSSMSHTRPDEPASYDPEDSQRAAGSSGLRSSQVDDAMVFASARRQAADRGPLSALVTSSLLIGPTGYRRLPRQFPTMLYSRTEGRPVSAWRGGCEQAQGAGGLDGVGPAVRAEFGVQVA